MSDEPRWPDPLEDWRVGRDMRAETESRQAAAFEYGGRWPMEGGDDEFDGCDCGCHQTWGYGSDGGGCCSCHSRWEE